MRPKLLRPTCLLLPLVPTMASALSVEIQGTKLETQLEGASCIDIAGDYPGVTVEPSEAGKTARICYNSAQVNSISILSTTFVAKPPAKQNVSIRFEHAFPAGINGKIMARAKLQGFFATANGVGIPTGDKVSLVAFFSQSAHDDTIAEPLDFSVGDQIDSALFDYSVKEPYLISGPRTLKGSLKVVFAQPGHKLTLSDASGISIDTGSSFEDKLDTLELPEGDEKEDPGTSDPLGQEPSADQGPNGTVPGAPSNVPLRPQ